jgi:hypothetical protein
VRLESGELCNSVKKATVPLTEPVLVPECLWFRRPRAAGKVLEASPCFIAVCLGGAVGVGDGPDPEAAFGRENMLIYHEPYLQGQSSEEKRLLLGIGAAVVVTGASQCHRLLLWGAQPLVGDIKR